ncbi:hypothetical protein K6U51_12585 [Vibrio fluvialis]|uniref:hypothetical protein n=1 Tax=Vibrio fluvialis TaxID=676 RepID=UPI001EEB75BE|nr:hypothetical protein [Vibrio fluvialis]MCG6387567.1 hypothetical protein [Vibrio fluvialis]MCG6418868.1 hypothetical protein [Vibrio fluvialis]
MKEKFTEMYQAAVERGDFPLFVVCHNTKDFGDKYVVRIHTIKKDQGGQAEISDEHALADSLDGIRKNMPDSCVCLARMPSDDPVIVETWM